MESEESEEHNKDDLVQISASLPELLQRISSYQRYKRFQLDINNQIEFCHDDSTCARTNPSNFRRSTKVSSTPVCNGKGPLGKPLSPVEQFQRSLHEQTSAWDNRRTNSTSINLLHLPERISNIEQYLGLNKGSNTPKDLLTRVSLLELRLLAVEGRSYEYLHAKEGSKSVPAVKKSGL